VGVIAPKEPAMTTIAPVRRPISPTTLVACAAAVVGIALAVLVALSVFGSRTAPSVQEHRTTAAVTSQGTVLGQHSGAAAERHFYAERPLVTDDGAPVATVDTGATQPGPTGLDASIRYFGSRGDG
jgi:hypothetical protein